MTKSFKTFKDKLPIVLQDSSTVIIIGHENPDFDSIGSNIGMKKICDHFGIDSYILVPDSALELEPGVKKIIDSKREKFNIITLDQACTLIDDNTTLVVTDTNSSKKLKVMNELPSFKRIVIIDHHDEDANTIYSDLNYINPTTSSASEIIAQLLINYKVVADKDAANALLAGIALDTKHYQINTTEHTHDLAKRLIKLGATQSEVSSLFMAEFETDRRISNLIYNNTIFENYARTAFQNVQVSFTLNKENPYQIYKREDLAKAADRLLDYSVDASFVLGYINEDVVSISARSKSDIDVGAIMRKFSGGGKNNSAATKINTPDIEELECRLHDYVMSGLEENSIEETPKIYKKYKTNLQ